MGRYNNNSRSNLQATDSHHNLQYVGEYQEECNAVKQGRGEETNHSFVFDLAYNEREDCFGERDVETAKRSCQCAVAHVEDCFERGVLNGGWIVVAVV
eukprot:311041-Ditylum_brightwellii.AAC.1